MQEAEGRTNSDSRSRSRGSDVEKRKFTKNQNLKNDFGAMHIFKKKQIPEKNADLPQDDEYTLGNNEIPNLENILDSRYERDFEQKFMQNKHNFEQVDQLLEE